MTITHLQNRFAAIAGQRTDKGIKAHNEDCIGMHFPEGNLLLTKGIAAVVADGVSAAEQGKEAAEICVQGFLGDYYSTPESWSVKTSVQRVLNSLNRWLYGQGQHHLQEHRGYICTFSAMIIKSDTAHLFHVGDSRIYRLRSGELECLTRDHVVRAGKNQKYLARAMGIDVGVDIDYRMEPVYQGDVYFLCSDGFYEFVSDAALEACLDDMQSEPDQEKAMHICNTLVEMALENGSDDNISCQVILVSELQEKPSHEVVNTLATLPFPPPMEPGIILDGYQVISEHHASNRSEIYQVRDMATGEILCLKVPSRQQEDDPAFIERFLLEDWIGQRVESPHVVSTRPPDRPRNYLYYLTEWVEGHTLAEEIRRHHPLDIGRAIEIIDMLVKGIRAFQRQEMVHEDIKPDNILVQANGMVKICDFGSVAVQGIEEIRVNLERDRVLGTAEYSAPEYRLWQKPDNRSEQFSLAVILYEMLTGKLPYGDAYIHCKTARDFSRLTYTPATLHNPLVPVWMDKAIRKALSINRELRYSCFSEWLKDLQTPNAAFMDTELAPLIQRKPVLVWQGVATLLGLLCLVQWYLMSH